MVTALNLTKEMDKSAELQLKNGDFDIDILFGSPESFMETDTNGRQHLNLILSGVNRLH